MPSRIRMTIELWRLALGEIHGSRESGGAYNDPFTPEMTPWIAFPPT